MIKYQDIHLADKEFWDRFQSLWAAGNYGEALDILSEVQLDSKVLNAAVFNGITDSIIDREEAQDPSFKQNRIEVASTPPTDMQSGEVYFHLT